MSNKRVNVSPAAFTADGKASVIWSNTGIPEGAFHGDGQGISKATAKSGDKKFRLTRDATTFGKRQALRMGEGTHLTVYVVNGHAKQYLVTGGKLVIRKKCGGSSVK